MFVGWKILTLLHSCRSAILLFYLSSFQYLVIHLLSTTAWFYLFWHLNDNILRRVKHILKPFFEFYI
uniref:Putative ovule protein n=1 Tax=Solanum chacoense TaxID=4108 RepID=A0A0V0HKJ5_SOLCH